MFTAIFNYSLLLAAMSEAEMVPVLTSLLKNETVLVIIGFVCTFFFGLVLGRLLFGGRRHDVLPSGLPELDVSNEMEGPKIKTSAKSKQRNEELEWRHEKLALTEQQVSEGHSRLGDWVNASGKAGFPGALAYPGNCLYYLAETVREERNLLGSDLSRFSLINKRISKMGEDLLPGFGEGMVPPPLTAWRQEAENCLEEIQQHAGVLKSRQKALREILEKISGLEKTIISENEVNGDFLKKSKSSLEDISSELDNLPGNEAHEITAKLDRQILELLKNPPKEDGDIILIADDSHFSDLLRILAVDAGQSGNVGKRRLLKVAEQAQEAFAAISIGDEEPDIPPVKEEKKLQEKAPPAAIFVDENGIDTEPLSLLPYEEPKRKALPPFTAYEPEPEPKEKLDDDFSMVLFCSNKPEWWDSNIYQGSHARARKITEVPGGINWIGIRRLDTGDQVFCRITKDELQGNGEGNPLGFNGSNELFYDAHHLGMFAESCKGDVETRFTYGGWGFGHRVNGFDIEEESGPPQASGWGGKKIPVDTVFEMTVFAELPKDAGESSVIS